MFKKTLLSLQLMASLSCLGQVVIMGGTATTAAGYPSAANAPLISTPDIALPGSGSAVGAPLSSAAANDSRFSARPVVYNPNAAAYVVPEANEPNAIPVAGEGSVVQAGAPNGTSESFENGIQHFESGVGTARNSNLSLGQIARSLRAQRRQTARTYTNDSITQMNARGVTIGNRSNEGAQLASAPAPSNAPAAGPAQAPVGTLVAENRAPALPQSDREAQPSYQSSAQTNPTAGQQRHRIPDQSEPAPAASPSASASAAGAAPPDSPKLPQTGSPLPLLLVFGGIGLAAGVLYWARR